MKFEELLQIVGDEPVFESMLLLAGSVNPADVRRQLSRWVQMGRIVQLRRGLYALAAPFQKRRPHPFTAANQMVRGSYVSCQSALSYYGVIPEFSAAITSVTLQRPAKWQTALGRFVFQRIKANLFYGYNLTELGQNQQAFLATPEKALLDLIHLQPGGDSPAYLRELRLQKIDDFKMDEVFRLAESTRSPKLIRAARQIGKFLNENEGYNL